MLRFWDILISGRIVTPPPPFSPATTDQMTRPQLESDEFRKEQLVDETLEKLCKTAVDDQPMYEVRKHAVSKEVRRRRPEKMTGDPEVKAYRADKDSTK